MDQRRTRSHGAEYHAARLSGHRAGMDRQIVIFALRCWRPARQHPLHALLRTSMLTTRRAAMHDLPALRALMDESITYLQQGFLTPAQIDASRHIMGLDTQLIEDGTYHVAMIDDALAGCGGWSRRNTLYGGDHSPGRNAALLDPAKHAARIRAMYTCPAYARRGVGRAILSICEHEAAREGFTRVELAGTLSGLPLYTQAGYRPVRHFQDARGGAPVPLVLMEKTFNPPGA